MFAKRVSLQRQLCVLANLSSRSLSKFRSTPPIRNLLQNTKTNLFLPQNRNVASNSNAFQKRFPLLVGVVLGGGATAAYYFLKSKPGDSDVEKDKEAPFVHEHLKEDLELLKEFGPIPYLLIGAGTASYYAYRAIRSKDPTAKVLIIGEEAFYPYLRPPLSKEMWYETKNLITDVTDTLSFTQYDGRSKSIFYEVPEFYFTVKDMLENKNGGVSLIRGKRVLKVDPVAQVVHLDKGEVITYKKCLIATGSKPKNLPLFEGASDSIKRHVTLFRGVPDFKKLFEISNKVKSITIVGGGYLGSELACGLAKKGTSAGVEVVQIFPEPGHLGKILPEYLGTWTLEKIKAEGVTVLSGTTVEKVAKNGTKIELSLSNGQVLSTDHVVVAVGADPRTELAQASEMELHETQGGFLVNAELEARKNLWVAGDASCFYDVKLGRRRVEHHDHALVSGRLAGENMSSDPRPYTHQSMFWSDLGLDIGFEAIGNVDASLPTVGIFAKKSDSESTQSEEKASQESNIPRPPEAKDDYKKGVVFYLKDNVIVGILMWNVFSKMAIARKVLNESKCFEDLTEVAKLFQLNSTEI